MTLVSQTHIPDDAFEVVSAAFEPKQITDLTLAIGVINAYNRLAIGFRRGPESTPPA